MKKLIRDNLPGIYPKKGEYRTAKEDEYYRELIKKLQEEVDEFKNGENIEELADIIEVIYSISEFKGNSIEDLEKIRKEKLTKRGGFKKRIIWESDK